MCLSALIARWAGSIASDLSSPIGAKDGISGERRPSSLGFVEKILAAATSVDGAICNPRSHALIVKTYILEATTLCIALQRHL